MNNKTRFSFSLDEDLKMWLETEADRIGITQGGLVNLALNKYKEDREVLTTMRSLDVIMDKLEKLNK